MHKFNVMGNKISNQPFVSCYICNKNIEDHNWCRCIKCNIILHNSCEKTFRGKKIYCECAYADCGKIGAIDYIRSAINL